MSLLFIDLAMGIRETLEVDEVMEQTGSDDRLRDAVAEGAKVESSLTCDDIPMHLTRAIDNAYLNLSQYCDTDSCFDNSSLLEDDNIVELQALIGVLVGKADEKFCLAETMQDNGVKHAVSDLMKLVDPILKSGGSSNGNARLVQAYSRMLSWQTMMVNLAPTMIDRQGHFPTDIDTHCPEPCSSCTRKHLGFIRDRDTERFQFKCILSRANKDMAPKGKGISCEVAKQRGLNFWQFKTWCTVSDWVTMACQQTRVASLLECGAGSFNLALTTSMSSFELDQTYQTCIEDSPNNRADGSNKLLIESLSDNLVSKNATSAFGVLLTTGMSTGLAAMRLAAKGNVVIEDAIEGDDGESTDEGEDNDLEVGEDGESTDEGEVEQDDDLLTPFKLSYYNDDLDSIYDGSGLFVCTGADKLSTRDLNLSEECEDLGIFPQIAISLIIVSVVVAFFRMPFRLASGLIKLVLSPFGLKSFAGTFTKVLAGVIPAALLVLLSTSKMGSCNSIVDGTDGSIIDGRDFQTVGSASRLVGLTS